MRLNNLHSYFILKQSLREGLIDMYRDVINRNIWNLFAEIFCNDHTRANRGMIGNSYYYCVVVRNDIIKNCIAISISSQSIIILCSY